MFGCLGRLGCLLLLLIVAGVIYLNRGTTRVFSRGGDTATAVRTLTWQPVTAEGATRARRAVESLRARGGPAFVNLTAGELASLVHSELSERVPGVAESMQAAVIGNHFYMRADIALKDLKAAGALGPLGGMLGDRETLTLGGRLELVQPGIAQYRLTEMRVRELTLPRAAIPRLLGQISRGERPVGVAEDAIPLRIQRDIGDIRVGQGKITLYRGIP